MRDERIDGIKGLLIFSVVLGHFLELCGGVGSGAYRIIYSFHMPAFIFISGYFSPDKPKKILKKFLPLYVVFQLLYLIFDSFFIGNKNLTFGAFFTPYWHLWYIFALMLYSLLLPIISRVKEKICYFALAIAVALSLLFPLADINMYFLSIGRFFAFLPFFVLGNFCGKGKIRIPSVSFLVPFSLIFILCGKWASIKMLYGSFSYSNPREMIIRAFLILFALGWISILFRIRLPHLFCILGQNTLPIYLLHGFFQRIMLTCETKLSGDITVFLVAVAVCFSLNTLNLNMGNPLKAVDKVWKKVYNNYKNERKSIWISKKRLKKLSKK